MKKISIITPTFNEELNIQDCYSQVKLIMDELKDEYSYEHIFSDNASTDGSVAKIRELCKLDENVKLLVNSRNVGPFRNMWNAMKFASGDAVLPLLAADLQDPPSVIPALISKWKNGNLVVYGVRANREEKAILRLARHFYYKMINRFSSSEIPLDAGEFLLADRKVIDSIISLDDQYPYIRGLIAQTGVRSDHVSYTWVKRKRGKSKNSFLDLCDQAINGFISTSRVPARFALLLGFLLSSLGIIGAVVTVAEVLINRNHAPAGIPTIIVSILFFGGVQLLFLGVIGEYVLSIHAQVRRSPQMFIVEKINL